jgi:N utilization substance protein B
MLDVGQVTEATALDYTYTEALQPEQQEWIRQRLSGTWGRREEFDQLLQAHLHNWSWDRVGRVERNLMRLAVYEMLEAKDLAFSAAISEAVALAKEYADEKSGAFINGVLDGVWKAQSLA